MNKKVVVSLILYIIGLTICCIALFPLKIEIYIPDKFGVLGILVSVISLIYGFVMMNYNIKIDGKMITSKLTPIYKFYIPILFMDLLVVNTILLVFNIYPGNDISAFIAIEIILTVWVLLSLPNLKLCQMFLENENIRVFNYRKSKTFRRDEIKKVHRYFIFFFKIKLNETSVIILPKISESVNLFVTPSSIKILKKMS